MQRFKSVLYVMVGFFAALGILAATQGQVAHAIGAAATPATLQVQVNTLIAQAVNQAAQIADLQNQVQTLQSQPGSQLTAQGVAVLSKFSLRDTGGSLNVNGKEMHLVGVNLHLEDGSGSTADGTVDSNGAPIAGKSLTGLGNLIIRYNSLRGSDANGNSQDLRTGSHNLVLGDQNNITSFGGLIAGKGNTISSNYATLTTGLGNTASGSFASVSGGQGNSASGVSAFVTGGIANTASGQISAVCGGQANTANGAYVSTVLGGLANTASGFYASVCGGQDNTASSDSSAVLGGLGNKASGSQASVTGGQLNTAYGNSSCVTGGLAVLESNG